MQEIAVIGSGPVRRGWSVVLVRAGHDVALYDSDANNLAAAAPLIEQTLGDLHDHGLLKKIRT